MMPPKVAIAFARPVMNLLCAILLALCGLPAAAQAKAADSSPAAQKPAQVCAAECAAQRKDLTGVDRRSRSLVLHRARLCAQNSMAQIWQAPISADRSQNANLAQARLEGAHAGKPTPAPPTSPLPTSMAARWGVRLVRAILDGAKISEAVLTGARMDGPR
jgi:uncharacterized protein YjbI with pentapeptide repeats